MLRTGLIIRFEGVWAGYDGPDVLQDVSFEVAEGEVAVVHGPTAAGKTTLIHMLRLALPPRAGVASLLGEDIAKLNARRRAKLKRRIGYIGEEPTFVEDGTVFENVALPLRLAGQKRAAYAEDVDELLSFVGLADLADEEARKLSFAERRRVAIARALAGKPAIILADEPAAGLSPEGAMRTFRLLAEMRRVGAAVIICTQNEQYADGIECQRWRMQQGRLTPDDDSAIFMDAESFT
ncbi:MAG: cell division ATP-binding protein FtsE [Hyphomonadaceae bacterium]